MANLIRSKKISTHLSGYKLNIPPAVIFAIVIILTSMIILAASPLSFAMSLDQRILRNNNLNYSHSGSNDGNVPSLRTAAQIVKPAVASNANSGKIVVVATGSTQSFDAQGTIDSITDITSSLSYHITGTWSLNVRDGSTVRFEANLRSFPSDTTLGKFHTHQLLNYKSNIDGKLDSNNDNFFTSGKTDIGTNNKISWKNVPVVITLRNGDTITITLDDTKAAHHFAGQSLTGEIQSITLCSNVPGAAMSVENLCPNIGANANAQDNTTGMGA